jgi:hypothetical protein
VRVCEIGGGWAEAGIQFKIGQQHVNCVGLAV